MNLHHKRKIINKTKAPERDWRVEGFDWYARCDSNARPSESESDTLSSWATGAYAKQCNEIYYTSVFHKKQASFKKIKKILAQKQLENTKQRGCIVTNFGFYSAF